MSELHCEVDGMLSVPVLVAGRHVTGYADVELVVDEHSENAVADALTRLRFERRGDVWARFHDCNADVVVTVPLHRWPGGVPGGEPDRMYADGDPVDGCRRLRWLATADELLVLAQRAARSPAPPPPIARERLHQVLVQEPSAWVTAAERAVPWRAEAAVRVARHAYDGARAPDGADLAELAVEAGPVLPARAGIVALSGLDGSGKSTQSHALAATLSKLGHDTSVEWTRLSFDAGLDRVAAPVKAVLRMRRGKSAGASGAVAVGDDESDAPRQLRARMPMVNHVWTAVVATANGRSQRNTTLRQLREGRVVVRDRYVLDSVVQLHTVYGGTTDVARQAAIVERLSPRPLAAFYLQLPPEEAYRRKPEEYTVEELAAHARLYEQQARRLGVQVVDATVERDVLAAQLSRTVWHLLT